MSKVISGKFLFNRENGRTLPYTEELAKRGDLIECTKSDGSDALIVDEQGETATEKAPAFLKNITTGRIFAYNEVLSRNSNMVPYEQEDIEPQNNKQDNSSDVEEDSDESRQEPIAADTGIGSQHDPEDAEEVQEIDLDMMDKKQIQSFLKDTYGYSITLRDLSTDKKARRIAAEYAENNDPL